MATSEVTTLRSTSPTTSIPRRRPDFIPTGHGLIRSPTVRSNASTSSDDMYEEEAVVHTASRARSTRSVKSASAASYLSHPSYAGRARLVPFVSGPRTPAQENGGGGHPAERTRGGASKRISSQSAVMIDVAPRPVSSASDADDLRLGAHYVRAFGEDEHADNHSVVSSTAKIPLTIRDDSRSCARYSEGSFSLAPSDYTRPEHNSSNAAATLSPPLEQYIVRAGQRFRFKMPISPPTGRARLVVRRTSGGALPLFMRAEPLQDEIHISGLPRLEDLGEIGLGAYDKTTGECVGLAIVEVVDVS
jgi:axial budding pattern protein 2